MSTTQVLLAAGLLAGHPAQHFAAGLGVNLALSRIALRGDEVGDGVTGHRDAFHIVVIAGQKQIVVVGLRAANDLRGFDDVGHDWFSRWVAASAAS